MFSYRHAFHAGNHADVLKHTALIATMRHLVEKDAALALLDSHAGAGLYRLDGDYASTSGEAAEGLLRLVAPDAKLKDPLAPALQDYLEVIGSFNKAGQHKIYPGSPFILHHLMREHDRLKLFEMHPTDAKSLDGNIAQLDAGRQIAVFREDGFEGVRRFLPPPTRRALLLCDPSYEIKSDYARVPEMVGEMMTRFATGTYMVWYPIIARTEAHAMPRKLKTMATRAGKTWLHACLTVKAAKITPAALADETTRRPGLPASGVFVINPPHTLKPALATALPQMVQLLGQDRHAQFTLDAG
jgi:23S rRNA (adenine2030-N6)-methyltransferase